MSYVIVVLKGAAERAKVVSMLAATGMGARGVEGGAGLYLELLKGQADVVLLERELGEEDGLDVTEKLRATPGLGRLRVLLLTPSFEARERVRALERGADVCLSAPVDSAELCAYVVRLARHSAEQGISRPLPWHFRQSEWRLVSPSGAGIELSHLEAAFIGIVARNAGKPVRRRDIIANAFGKDPLSYDGRRLEALVSRLRKKLNRISPTSQPIKVVHSIGYVFTDAIQCI